MVVNLRVKIDVSVPLLLSSSLNRSIHVFRGYSNRTKIYRMTM